MVKALVSHQCVLRSFPRPGVICGLSLCLVFHSAVGGFTPGTPVFPSKTNISKFQFDPGMQDISERNLTPWYSVGKKITYFFSY